MPKLDHVDFTQGRRISAAAKPGEIILGVDMSIVSRATEQGILSKLYDLGYSPTIKFLETAEGLHTFFVLKQEKPDRPIPDNYLLDEWWKLAEVINPPQAVHLWRGAGLEIEGEGDLQGGRTDRLAA